MAWIYRNPFWWVLTLVGTNASCTRDHPRMGWIYLGNSAFNCMRSASTMAA